jgi:hypothetical protein
MVFAFLTVATRLRSRFETNFLFVSQIRLQNLLPLTLVFPAMYQKINVVKIVPIPPQTKDSYKQDKSCGSLLETYIFAFEQCRIKALTLMLLLHLCLTVL